MSEEEARYIVRGNNISYIYWGQEEQAIAPMSSGLTYSFLEEVYKNERVVVYRVKKT
jgi:uncharacterized membrane protein